MIIDARENGMEATALCVADRATRSPPQALVFFGSIAAIRRSHRVNGRVSPTTTGVDAVLTDVAQRGRR